MAEQMEMPLGLWTRVDPSKHMLHGGAYWRNRANTTEPSVFGWAELGVGDAALCQTTLTACCFM